MDHVWTMAPLALAAALGGCSPALDWRAVRDGPAGVQAMFPCKPERETRTVALAGRDVPMQAQVCRADGSTFALMSADIGSPATAAQALQQWKAASVAALRADSVSERRFVPPGALDLPQSVQVVASGTRPDGSRVRAQAAWFARGSHVFEAAVYTAQLRAELVDPFFGGLRFE